ncbi:Transposase, partial [Candidatus Magnetomorum sp. HK-1]
MINNPRIKISKRTIGKLESQILKAERDGDIRTVKRITAVLKVADGYLYKDIAEFLGVSTESIRKWVNTFIIDGAEGLKPKKIPGRKSRLSKSQKKELGKIIDEGPEKAGLKSGCWRSPMIQKLIYDKFKVFYSVYYISQLLKDMGFSFQKGKFEAAKIDPEARKEWEEKTWPKISKEAKEKNAHIMFGDEASFPQ